MIFRNLLVPIDPDDETTWREPLSTALGYAGWSDAAVHVLTVIPAEMFRMTVVAQVIPEDFEDRLRDDAKARLAAAVAQCDSGGREIRQIVRLGKIHSEILDAARDLEADLIVMAAHRPEFGDFLTGSVTEQVVRRAPCSVWIIRD